MKFIVGFFAGLVFGIAVVHYYYARPVTKWFKVDDRRVFQVGSAGREMVLLKSYTLVEPWNTDGYELESVEEPK